MKAFARSRVVLMLTAAGLAVFPYALTAIAQDVGGESRRVIFRPKNPETKKRTPKPSTVVKPGNRSTRVELQDPAHQWRIELRIYSLKETRFAMRGGCRSRSDLQERFSAHPN